jgi:hypothetical protein
MMYFSYQIVLIPMKFLHYNESLNRRKDDSKTTRIVDVLAICRRHTLQICRPPG